MQLALWAKSRKLVSFNFLLVCSLLGCGPKYDLKEDAHNAVKSLLKDPDSAKFDDELIQVYLEAGLVCDGRVNAKNSYGAYNGFETYYFSRERGAAIGDNGQALTIMEECTKETKAETARIYKSMGKEPPPPDAIEVEASAAADAAAKVAAAAASAAAAAAKE